MSDNMKNLPRKKFRKAKLEEKKHRLPLEKKYYDTFDMVQMFNVNARTLQRWRTEGKIPFTKIGGRIYYHADEIEEIMRSKDAHD